MKQEQQHTNVSQSDSIKPVDSPKMTDHSQPNNFQPDVDENQIIITSGDTVWNQHDRVCAKRTLRDRNNKKVRKNMGFNVVTVCNQEKSNEFAVIENAWTQREIPKADYVYFTIGGIEKNKFKMIIENELEKKEAEEDSNYVNYVLYAVVSVLLLITVAYFCGYFSKKSNPYSVTLMDKGTQQPFSGTIVFKIYDEEYTVYENKDKNNIEVHETFTTNDITVTKHPDDYLCHSERVVKSNQWIRFECINIRKEEETEENSAARVLLEEKFAKQADAAEARFQKKKNVLKKVEQNRKTQKARNFKQIQTNIELIKNKQENKYE